MNIALAPEKGQELLATPQQSSFVSSAKQPARALADSPNRNLQKTAGGREDRSVTKFADSFRRRGHNT
jgi:hypothetical protein